MTIARDSRIGRGYIAREGDTGSVVWRSSRDTHDIGVGAAAVTMPAAPGQIVFGSTTLNGIVAPGVSTTPAPIANPSAVRIRISNSPYTGASVGASTPKNPDGEWLIPRDSTDSYFLQSWRGEGGGYPTYPHFILDTGTGTPNGIRFVLVASAAAAEWITADPTNVRRIGVLYGTMSALSNPAIASPPFYVAPGYGTIEILEWLP